MSQWYAELHSCQTAFETDEQPGVADEGMEHLVDEKVEAFWKGIDGGVNKRGQITVTFSEKRPKKSWFQVYAGEVRAFVTAKTHN